MSFRHLRSLAEQAVLDTIAGLPAALRGHAEQLPVLLEDWPRADPGNPADDADLLGQFNGDPVGAGSGEASPLPRSICLFLGPIWEFAGREESRFVEEVRVTFLHEFGHFLGLEEDELEDRGLL